MKDALVGYTGFVGSNLYAKHNFEGLFNSKNIESAFGTKPELLVYAGIRAEMYIANKFPEEDKRIILDAINNIKKINPLRIVLISTISVYNNPVDIDETCVINTDTLTPYGADRHYLEQWVTDNYDDYLIIRLPALYGDNIKKNFIYDMIHYIPALLNEKKYNELNVRDDIIKQSYEKLDNGFYKCVVTDKDKRLELKKHFKQLGFSALNFTDSRSQYQFYNIKYLWDHISIALKKHINILNTATEPVTASELINYVYGYDFANEIKDDYPIQDYKTIHYKEYGGKAGYIFDKSFVMNDIKNFINNYRE